MITKIEKGTGEPKSLILWDQTGLKLCELFIDGQVTFPADALIGVTELEQIAGVFRIFNALYQNL